ncbi:MAG: ATP synthase F0 subunit C [Candidatus Omnitrophota bacterium]|nr:ATP synthase F0 subunit C [Candidatus Omnitrophota bacterium]
MSRNIALIIIFGLSILGPCAVFAASGFAGINALGRNPSSAPKIFTAMILALVFAEALALIVVLVAFQLFSASN